MRRALLLLLVGLTLAAAGPVPDAALNDETTAEGWIWRQTQAGNVADFNARCGTGRLDPHVPSDPRWSADCRSVNPAALRALLARPGLADAAPHGVRLRGARIAGALNLDDVHLAAAEFSLIGCSLAGDLVVTAAHIDGWLVFDGTVISGNLDMSAARIDRGMMITNKTTIEGAIELSLASIGDALTLTDATLAGGMNAPGVKIGSFLVLANSGFDADVKLVAAKVQGALAIQGVKFAAGKQLDATEMQVGSFVGIVDAEFGGAVNLSGLSVPGNFAMTGVTFAAGRQLNASGLQIGGSMLAKNVTFGGGLSLDGAVVRDEMSMIGTKFGAESAFTANGFRVGGTFLVDPAEFADGVAMKNASIGRNLIMRGAHVGVGKSFNARGLQVGGDLGMEDAELGGSVDLAGGNIRGEVVLDQLKLGPDAVLSMESLRVGRHAYFRNVGSAKPVNAAFLVVGGSLDLRGATLGGLDLSGAVVEGDLRLGGRYDNGPEAWTKWVSQGNKSACVVLRNTSVGNLQDDERSWDAATLVLEGFAYRHLGGVGGVSRQDMRNRPVESWRRWLARDPDYSPQPYTQLASVLAASGNNDASAAIRFAGRDRERTELLRGCGWWHPSDAEAATAVRSPCDLQGWFGLSVLQATIGYGIGTYTFRAVWWTLGLALIGTAVLAFAPGVRGPAGAGSGRSPRLKPLLWCFGASLNHVLPVVSLSPEFTDFFNDPQRERLHAWQQIAFAVLALGGWALSFFVIAALSGLTQS